MTSFTLNSIVRPFLIVGCVTLKTYHFTKCGEYSRRFWGRWRNKMHQKNFEPVTHSLLATQNRARHHSTLQFPILITRLDKRVVYSTITQRNFCRLGSLFEWKKAVVVDYFTVYLRPMKNSIIGHGLWLVYFNIPYYLLACLELARSAWGQWHFFTTDLEAVGDNSNRQGLTKLVHGSTAMGVHW